MPHDGDFKCSQHLKKDKGHFIMSSALDQFTNLWQWSNCSRQLLTEYLELVLSAVIPLFNIFVEYICVIVNGTIDL